VIHHVLCNRRWGVGDCTCPIAEQGRGDDPRFTAQLAEQRMVAATSQRHASDQQLDLTALEAERVQLLIRASQLAADLGTLDRKIALACQLIERQYGIAKDVS
jgi:hypothetical protein